MPTRRRLSVMRELNVTAVVDVGAGAGMVVTVSRVCNSRLALYR
jgi:hypothetical protein